MYFSEIDIKFANCHKLIDESNFTEADSIASDIFKEIKILKIKTNLGLGVM